LIVPLKTVATTLRRSTALSPCKPRKYANKPGPRVPFGKFVSSLLMNAIRSSPVGGTNFFSNNDSCVGLAQLRQRYGSSIKARYARPLIVASASCVRSRSSKNFRNIIQVSIGKRSASPFKPLSLRMMSRTDLTTLERRCGEVSGVLARGGTVKDNILI
jgi:hypothetical protein